MALDLRDQLQESLGSQYTIERELAGGMSRVFVALETRLGRRVVIKVLSPELAAAVSAERFEREMRIAAQLQDPRIVPVLRAGDIGGLPYYTMPFVEGESLRARLKGGRLPIAHCVAILRDVALALEHAHARGIVHRDIKPENILLAGSTAVVTDFGIAKAIATSTHASGFSITQGGLALGTPAYMSPEQALGEATVDHRADIYAWGVMAYELLAGEHPFGAKAGSHAMVGAHIGERPAPLGSRAQGLPADLANVVDRSLRKDPAARPPNATELVRALDGALAGRGMGATRRRLLRMVVGIALAAAIVVIVGFIALRARFIGAAPDAAPNAVHSIAVMGFADVGGDSTVAYLGDGMTDALTTTLAKLPNLRLIAPRSLGASPGKRLDSRDAGKALNVDAVLEGTVQRLEGQLRIRAHLIRVADGAVIWGERYDRRATNMFQLEDDITAAIASELRGTLSGERSSVTGGVPRGTTDPEAYDLYLKGRYAWSKRGSRGLGTAIDLFNAAIARDPKFARAHAGLAMSYVVLPLFSRAITADSGLALALSSGRRALALDSSVADAHLAIAYARKMQWKWSEAERSFRVAAALAPDEAEVHHWYGVYLFAVGEADRSVAELRRARELDPFASTIGIDGALAMYSARSFGDARQEIHRALVLDSTREDGWWVRAKIELAQGHADSAITSLIAARKIGVAFDVRSYLSAAYRALGRIHDADSAYAELRRAYAAGRATPYDVAVAAVSAGDRATAIAALERVVARRDMLVTELSLPCDPIFDPLKDDPRFEKLRAAAGMKVCPATRSNNGVSSR
jgi:TolB-like protein/tetratricopeptide (TPR) repeat protein